MTKQEIIDQIAESITSNGLQKINGVILNTILTALAEIIPDDSMLTSSFGGVVKATDTIIATPGVSRWFIAKGGVYTDYGGFTLLDKNFNILSYDGGKWDKVEIEIPNFQISPTFDPTTSTQAQGGKQIAGWLGLVENVIPKILGVTLVGNSTTPVGGIENSFFSNTYNKATKDLIIKSVVTNFATGGEFKVAITSDTNQVVYNSSTVYTAAAGIQTTILPDIELKQNYTIWLVTTLNSTAVVRYGASGNPNGGNFIQRPPAGNIVSGSAGSYYSFYFNAESHEMGGVLQNYLLRSEAESSLDDDDLTVFGSTANNTSIGQQGATAYYILKIPFLTDKVIKELNFTCSSGGNMTFVIGSLDQANKFIEERAFTVTAVTGVNAISVDQLLRKGQYIGVKTPGRMPNIHTVLQNNYTWGVEGNYANPLFAFTSWSLGLSFKAITKFTVENPLVRRSAIDNLQNQIDNFQPSKIWQSPDGVKWKVGVTNTGQFTAQAVGRYTKILHLGNSILKHGIVSYWWGLWGMAAKTREDDYAHRFLAKIKVANPTAQSWEENIAAWEQNPTGFNKASLDTLLTSQTYDLVIVRLGENATSVPASTYKNEFRNLITYIQSKVPTARIIIGGMFWTNEALDAAMKDIAIEKNLTYVDMSGLNIAANKSFIGDVVQGDDGQSHTINNQGVADHPNNAGMEAIATRLFNAANS